MHSIPETAPAELREKFADASPHVEVEITRMPKCKHCGWMPRGNFGCLPAMERHLRDAHGIVPPEGKVWWIAMPHDCEMVLAVDADAELARLREECASLRERVDSVEQDRYRMSQAVIESLGRALGYKDAADGGVNVGGHVAESIAAEAAGEIRRLRARVEEANAIVATLMRLDWCIGYELYGPDNHNALNDAQRLAAAWAATEAAGREPTDE